MQIRHNLYTTGKSDVNGWNEYYVFSIHPTEVFIYESNPWGEAIHTSLCIVDRAKSIEEIEKDFAKKFCENRQLIKIDPK